VDCYSVYSVAKDFAGPVATAGAASVAVFVTWSLGSRQVEIAQQQAKIAQQQADLASEKLRHDLYNRRFEIFTSFFDYYEAVMSWKESPTLEQQAARQRFFRAYQESDFLFTKDSGISDLLKMLNAKGNEVIGHKENPGIYAGDPARRIEQQEKVTKILLGGFDEGLAELRAAMHPYLDFSKI
jgi:hypothetical protein